MIIRASSKETNIVVLQIGVTVKQIFLTLMLHLKSMLLKSSKKEVLSWVDVVLRSLSCYAKISNTIGVVLQRRQMERRLFEAWWCWDKMGLTEATTELVLAKANEEYKDHVTWNISLKNFLRASVQQRGNDIVISSLWLGHGMGGPSFEAKLI